MMNTLRAAAASAVSSKQTNQPEPTTFAVLGQLTNGKLTRIRGVAERGELNKSRLAGSTFTLKDIAVMKDENIGQNSGYTIFIEDTEEGIKQINPSTYRRAVNTVSNLGELIGISSTVKKTSAKAKYAQKSTTPVSGLGGSRTSKKTQRRRQKRQNRKSRHI